MATTLKPAQGAYGNSESLVWRDSGALLQTLALAAELYGLGFCPLGILGSAQ
jgi:nitroreductase